MSDLIHTSAADCPEAAARLDVLKEPVAPAKGRSTGPRSTPGKRRSSRNALKSGYFSKELAEHMRSKQDQEDFRRLLNGLLDYWKPVGQAELIQVELIASHLRDSKQSYASGQRSEVMRTWTTSILQAPPEQTAQFAKNGVPIFPISTTWRSFSAPKATSWDFTIEQ